MSPLDPSANKFHVGNGDDGKHYWLTPTENPPHPRPTVKPYNWLSTDPNCPDCGLRVDNSGHAVVDGQSFSVIGDDGSYDCPACGVGYTEAQFKKRLGCQEKGEV